MKKTESINKNRLRHALRLAKAAKEAGISVEFHCSVKRPEINLN